MTPSHPKTSSENRQAASDLHANFERFFNENFPRLVDELRQWLAIPSISSLPEHRADLRRAAEWLQKKMAAIGFAETELIETAGHPLVYGEWPATGSSRDEAPADQAAIPTLLLYGHYDVQPTDPLNEWRHPPFSATVTGEHLYGRGASDDKGQVLLVLAALEAWARVAGGPPVHIKMLVEGEEECGGEGIAAYVKAHPERLAADAVLICDTAMLAADRPSLVCGLRGLLYTEITVFGAERDLHSGAYGGVAPNPLQAICLLLARLKGEDGVIRIPQLLAATPGASAEEERFWREDPADIAADLRREMGVSELVGEAGYPPLARIGLRPTLELHGISGGFSGTGAKTVIPAKATAKVSLRLPAGLAPEVVFPWLETAVQANLPAGHRARVTMLHGGLGLHADQDNPFLQAAADSLRAVYGTAPLFLREGGSIPVAALFAGELKTPVVLMGFALPDDAIHAPNERFSLGQFRRGMRTVARFLGKVGG